MTTYKVIAASGLNIRSGPGTEWEEEGTLTNGEIIISPDVTEWLPILLQDDEGVQSIGWVKRQYVQETTEVDHQIEAVEIQPVPQTSGSIMQKDLIKLYGYPKERAGYLTTIDLREFASHLGHVKDFKGNPWGCRIYGHEALIVPLKKAFQSLCDTGAVSELRTYDGCFNIRKMTGGSSYSTHSWGMAVDFNAAENPYGGSINFSDDFAKCFADAGFEWGGLWNTPDGMHFQLPHTKDWSNSDNTLRPTT